MGLWPRMKALFSATLNDLLDSVEDPELMKKQKIEDLRALKKKAQVSLLEIQAIGKRTSGKGASDELKEIQTQENLLKRALEKIEEEIVRATPAYKHSGLTDASFSTFERMEAAIEEKEHLNEANNELLAFEKKTSVESLRDSEAEIEKELERLKAKK